MKVGFTGTRYGMTKEQLGSFGEMLTKFSSVPEFHHGDCKGSDAEAHEIAEWIAQRIVIHPPVDDEHQARCVIHGDGVVLEPLTHFARNRNIVNMTDMLIATPYNEYEEAKGGTWYTINFARKQNKSIAIIWPSGQITLEFSV